MSTAEILSLISTICYVIAGISFVLAIFFWFYFKIPTVIGDLSGRTARKSIERIRSTNAKKGGQGYRSGAAIPERGRKIATVPNAGNPAPESGEKPAGPTANTGTAPRPEGKKKAEQQNQPETGLLRDNKAAAPEEDQGTEMLQQEDGTALLADDGSTALLQEEAAPAVPRRSGGRKMTMLESVMLIHTNEVIR